MSVDIVEKKKIPQLNEFSYIKSYIIIYLTIISNDIIKRGNF